MLQRWDPFSDLRQIQDTMDRMWRQVGTSGRPLPGGTEIEAWAVPLDVIQRGEATVVRASMPGVSPDDIDVSIDDNVLTIKGRTADEYGEEQGSYLMRERRTGSFHRVLRLPESVDPDRVEPRYDHGILTITIPKAAEKQARQLRVRVGSAPVVEADGA